MIKASVIIPTYNRKDSLLRLLDSLSHQTMNPENYEVIVVEDGSSSISLEEKTKVYPFALKYFQQENRGATIARNNGAKKSQGQILIFIDDDVTVAKGALEALTDACTRNPKTIALGSLETCNINTESAFTSIQLKVENEGFNQDNAHSAAINYVDCNTQLLAIGRSEFFDLGMLHDPTGGWPNWDDVDLGYRANNADYQIIRVREAKGKHWDNSLSDLNSASQRWYRASKSAVRLFQKYPDLADFIPMYTDKMPINWRKDSSRLIVRKLIRWIASSKVSLFILHAVIDILEKYYPNPGILRPLYRYVCGGYMYQGYQQGMKEFGTVPE